MNNNEPAARLFWKDLAPNPESRGSQWSLDWLRYPGTRVTTRNSLPAEQFNYCHLGQQSLNKIRFYLPASTPYSIS